MSTSYLFFFYSSTLNKNLLTNTKVTFFLIRKNKARPYTINILCIEAVQIFYDYFLALTVVMNVFIRVILTRSGLVYPGPAIVNLILSSSNIGRFHSNFILSPPSNHFFDKSIYNHTTHYYLKFLIKNIFWSRTVIL